ncbi:hypothetical protein GYMLUDRAFT_175298 [Collybiopsis luxurians FD-317 M1]|uniref:Tc1-like transposase DDE domain-containing protein n=1 Tax=Collybiopsis luxurians FD-317 M1 TaxID=944289 RepID=A0A0D0CCA3_9AGAR|nr:hypothetical protein GYMLUDRAFT_175298 [Collybiopsis luxurians FD-317 M1]
MSYTPLITTCTRYSILPAISLNGVLYLDILTCSWTSKLFKEFISALLDNINPFPQQNSVIIMNNASTCHCEGIREMGFSAMKAWIQSNGDYPLGEMLNNNMCDLISLLWEAVFTAMSPQSIEGWFYHSGYVL